MWLETSCSMRGAAPCHPQIPPLPAPGCRPRPAPVPAQCDGWQHGQVRPLAKGQRRPPGHNMPEVRRGLLLQPRQRAPRANVRCVRAQHASGGRAQRRSHQQDCQEVCALGRSGGGKGRGIFDFRVRGKQIAECLTVCRCSCSYLIFGVQKSVPRCPRCESPTQKNKGCKQVMCQDPVCVHQRSPRFAARHVGSSHSLSHCN